MTSWGLRRWWPLLVGVIAAAVVLGFTLAASAHGSPASPKYQDYRGGAGSANPCSASSPAAGGWTCYQPTSRG
jgi:hypothetical protein